MLIRPFSSTAGDPTEPFQARSGEGYYLIDAAGRRILDAVSGMWHVPLGYSCPSIAEAVLGQLQQLPAASLFSVSHAAAVELGMKLPLALGLRGWRCFLLNNGSDAVEAALALVDRVAAINGREAAIRALPGGFHGHTHRLRRLERGSIPDTFDSESLPALLFEPVQGVAGLRGIEPATSARLIEAQASGAILISDEVGCGLWRTGHAVAAEAFGITPDIIILSKGLTNGVAPLSAVLIAPRLVELLGAELWEDGRTSGGSPLACAAGLAVLGEMTAPDRVAARQAATQNLAELALELSHELGCTYRQYGLAAGIELPLEHPLSATARAMANACFVQNGLLCRIAGDGRTITLVPGFGFLPEDFRALRDRFVSAIHALGCL